MTDTAVEPRFLEDPDYPKQRTCPYAIPDDYVEYRERAGSLTQVRLYTGEPAWLVTGHQAARSLLSDTRISSDRRLDGYPFLHPSTEALRHQPPSFIHLDDPQHEADRKMVTGQFTLKKVRAMRPHIEQIVQERLDVLLAAEKPADFVSAVSLAVPSLMICELLGLPASDRDHFQAKSEQLIGAPTPEVMMSAWRELEVYLEGQVDSRLDDPGPGLIGTLITDRLHPGEIDRDQLVAHALLMLIAGHETTASMTSMSVLTLLEHPDQYQLLKDDRSLIPGAVDELLRFLTVVDIAGSRVALEDIEIDGTLIRAGDSVVISPSIANRDPEEFENPDTFDVRRPTRHHLSFGFGTHQCLGHNLARLEIGVVIEALIERIPTLALAVPVEELELRPGATVQGVNVLPVTW